MTIEVGTYDELSYILVELNLELIEIRMYHDDTNLQNVLDRLQSEEINAMGAIPANYFYLQGGSPRLIGDSIVDGNNRGLDLKGV